MVILVKTGSDATGVAVRVARGYTDRPKILRCGYHGWHDWCVEVHGGVPEQVSSLTIEFPYGDLDALEKALEANRGEVAGIILTPVGHPLERAGDGAARPATSKGCASWPTGTGRC